MKSKYILSAGTIGIVLMMLGQLSFAINDTLVKDIVVVSQDNMSVINIIFLRGIISTFLIFLYLKYFEKKNIINILKIKGEILIRPMMYLALSYDHRIIDGKDSVSFLKCIKENLEDPRRLFLDL